MYIAHIILYDIDQLFVVIIMCLCVHLTNVYIVYLVNLYCIAMVSVIGMLSRLITSCGAEPPFVLTIDSLL